MTKKEDRRERCAYGRSGYGTGFRCSRKEQWVGARYCRQHRFTSQAITDSLKRTVLG